MINNKSLSSIALSVAVALSGSALAETQDVQDMSDPLSVYTQAGLGYTDKGLNLKIGQAYDTVMQTAWR